MCIKNDTKLKTWQKTLFFTSKLSRIYRLVTSIDLVTFRERSAFVTSHLKMLTLFSSIGDLLETSKTYSEKERVGEKIELF